MITPQMAWSIRTEFGHSLNPDAEFSCVRLAEIARRAATLYWELRELDAEIKDMAEPPTLPDVPPTIGKIIMRPSPAHSRAAAALRQLRMGRDVEVDCLEVLDVLLTALGTGDTTVVVATKGPMSLEMASRLRFQRGFEVRPTTPSVAAGDGHVHTTVRIAEMGDCTYIQEGGRP